jgi:hypothetical protein
MQIFYSQAFPEEIVKKLQALGYSMEPFKISYSDSGICKLEGVPKELVDKTVFLASSNNLDHGFTYSLIKYVGENSNSKNIVVAVTDAHFDWEDEFKEDSKTVGPWNFLSHVAKLPYVQSIYNWGGSSRYEKYFDFNRNDGSKIRVESSTTLPNKQIIFEIRKGCVYLSLDLDVIGSEAMYDPSLTGGIKLKTSVSDLILFVHELQPNYMDIYLDPDETSQTIWRDVFKRNLNYFIRLLEGIYSEDPKILEEFKYRVETELDMISFINFCYTNEVPDFLGDKSKVDTVVKTMLEANEGYLKRLANHSYYSISDLCHYLLQAFEGKFTVDRVDELFLPNIDKKILLKLNKVTSLNEKIQKEKWFGDFKPWRLSNLQLIQKIKGPDQDPIQDAYAKKLKEIISAR